MIYVDRLLSAVATLYAQMVQWWPIGQRILLTVTSSRDPTLIGQILRGAICNTSPDVAGKPTKAVVTLDVPLTYVGHYRRAGISIVRIEPTRTNQALSRLAVGLSIAVRIIDCDADDARDRLLADARMTADLRPT